MRVFVLVKEYNNQTDSKIRPIKFPQPWNFTKRDFRHRFFSVNFAKFLRKPVFIEHLQWLLRYIFYVLKLSLNCYLTSLKLSSSSYRHVTCIWLLYTFINILSSDTKQSILSLLVWLLFWLILSKRFFRNLQKYLTRRYLKTTAKSSCEYLSYSICA